MKKSISFLIVILMSIGSYAQQSAVENYNLGNEFKEKEQHEKAFQHYMKAAESGYAKAMIEVGNYYDKSDSLLMTIGIKHDEKKAFDWWKKAATEGSGIGMLSIAEAYQEGTGVEKDTLSAILWSRMAIAALESEAQNGDTDSMVELAECYTLGIKHGIVGLNWNPEVAFDLYTKAAKAGNKECLEKLTLSSRFCYFFDDHYIDKPSMDLQLMSIKGLEFAAKMGYIDAMDALSEFYDNDKYSLKDPKKAAYWEKKYEKAEKAKQK